MNKKGKSMTGASIRMLASLMLVSSHILPKRRQNWKNRSSSLDRQFWKQRSSNRWPKLRAVRPPAGKAKLGRLILEVDDSPHSVFNSPSYERKDDDGKLRNQRRRQAELQFLQPQPASLLFLEKEHTQQPNLGSNTN